MTAAGRCPVRRQVSVPRVSGVSGVSGGRGRGPVSASLGSCPLAAAPPSAEAVSPRRCCVLGGIPNLPTQPTSPAPRCRQPANLCLCWKSNHCIPGAGPKMSVDSIRIKTQVFQFLLQTGQRPDLMNLVLVLAWFFGSSHYLDLLCHSAK